MSDPLHDNPPRQDLPVPLVGAPPAAHDREPGVEKPGLLKRFLRAYRKASGGSLLLSIFLHAIILIVGIFLVVSQVVEERKISFGGGEPGPKGDVQHKVQMKRKTTSAPAPTKRITTTSSMARVALPDMPDIPMSMGPSVAGAMGTGGFGASSGLGGGKGGGGGGAGFSNIKFFGLRTQAKHIAFLVDYSGSMEGVFRKAMEAKLEESLKELPAGTKMLIIPWAGGAWLHNEIADDKIKSNWKIGKGYDDFSILPGKKLTTPAWVSISPDTVTSLMAGIKAQKSWPGGTDWLSPFRYAMEASPPPDVIFFMTDSQMPADNVSKKLAQVDRELNKGARPPVVNCIWIQNKTCDPQPMKRLAAKYKGEFRQIDKNGLLLEQ